MMIVSTTKDVRLYSGTEMLLRTPHRRVSVSHSLKNKSHRAAQPVGVRFGKARLWLGANPNPTSANRHDIGLPGNFQLPRRGLIGSWQPSSFASGMRYPTRLQSARKSPIGRDLRDGH